MKNLIGYAIRTFINLDRFLRERMIQRIYI